ncbi:MAG: SRPBCC family protein [Acidimicrobiales bacterium]
MAEQATERMVVRASPAQCFAAVIAFEAYAGWAVDIKSVAVEARDDQGRGTRVTFRAAAFGRSTTYTLEYDYATAPGGLSWVQTEGDVTSRLDGHYVFEPTDEGDTEVTYHLDVELRVPIPGFVKRRAEGRIIHTALGDLKARVEAEAGSAQVNGSEPG